jgi:hypothetical protein
MQHQFTKIMFRFLKLSIVKILPKAAIQEKNATQVGTLVFQMLLQGKESAPKGLNAL